MEKIEPDFETIKSVTDLLYLLMSDDVTRQQYNNEICLLFDILKRMGTPFTEGNILLKEVQANLEEDK